MRKRIIALIAGLMVSAAAVSPVYAANYPAKITKAEFASNIVTIEASLEGQAPDVILQVSTDKTFRDKDKTITLSTKGAKLTNFNVSEDIYGVKVSELWYEKIGLIHGMNIYEKDGQTQMYVAGSWKNFGNAKKASHTAEYTSERGTTVYNFSIETKKSFAKSAKVYARIKGGAASKWGSYSAKKVAKYVKPVLRQKTGVIAAPLPEARSVAVTNASGGKISVKKGSTKTLSIKVTPVNADGKTTFSSSNKKTVTVDKNGKIKGIKKGTAKITVKHGGKKAVVTVTVK